MEINFYILFIINIRPEKNFFSICNFTKGTAENFYPITKVCNSVQKKFYAICDFTNSVEENFYEV